MTLAAAVIGYLLGAIPTATWLAKRFKGIDLTSVGSGNPGANNALRTGGPGLAAVILLFEVAKGALAVVAGLELAGDPGGLAAGLGAVAGNVYNVFFGLNGGKGLGITGGVLVAAWPTVVVPITVVLILGTWITRSSGAGTIIGIVAINAMAALWIALEIPIGWGFDDPYYLAMLSLGLGIVLWRRHWAVARFTRSSPA